MKQSTKMMARVVIYDRAPARRLIAAGVITRRAGRTVQITRTANGGRGTIRPAANR